MMSADVSSVYLFTYQCARRRKKRHWSGAVRTKGGMRRIPSGKRRLGPRDTKAVRGGPEKIVWTPRDWQG